jgi:multiple sugar transport system permease protein
MRWPGREVAFVGVLATMMLPSHVRMIPLYLIFTRLDWINTYLPLIVPSYFGSAWYIFLLRQFFRSIPSDLTDAAKIDGCSEFGILMRVILPLVRPAIAVVALFEFIGSWNSYLGPLIYLYDKRLFPISLGLASLRDTYGMSNFAIIMAASVITTAPIVILFFFTQRTFIQGITFTGLKG